jgi:hypothetical protein
MAERLVHDETPMEYFKRLVEGALVHQRVQSSEHTTFYVVNLLAAFVCPPRETASALSEPLAVRLARAMQTAGLEQREGLRLVGDVSLFLSGFFADSFARKIVDVDYYISLGGYAYGCLSQRHTDDRAPVFSELAQKFTSFVDVLSEVSERSAPTSSTDLLRLYEKWLRTRSPRNGELLVEQGIVPNQSLSMRFLH